eukprot:scaffold92361_cov66-Phaeocystis_antarctica.AAC.2
MPPWPRDSQAERSSFQRASTSVCATPLEAAGHSSCALSTANSIPNAHSKVRPNLPAKLKN